MSATQGHFKNKLTDNCIFVAVVCCHFSEIMCSIAGGDYWRCLYGGWWCAHSQGHTCWACGKLCLGHEDCCQGGEPPYHRTANTGARAYLCFTVAMGKILQLCLSEWFSRISMSYLCVSDQSRSTHWACAGWCSRRKNAALLSVWGHSQYSIPNGESWSPWLYTPESFHLQVPYMLKFTCLTHCKIMHRNITN